MSNAQIWILLIITSQVTATFPPECKDLVLYSIFGTFGGCLFISSIVIFFVARRRKINSTENSENVENVEGKRNNLFEDELDVIYSGRKRHDSGFIASSIESIIPFSETFPPKKSPSMPNLSKKLSFLTNHTNYNEEVFNSNCSHPPDIFNCIQLKQFRSFGAQTDSLSSLKVEKDVLPHESVFGLISNKSAVLRDIRQRKLKMDYDMNFSDFETVVIEKKNANSMGLDFGIAGVFIKKMDMDEISFKQGSLSAGDEVISINGVSVFGLSSVDAFPLFVEPASNVCLEIRKGDFLSKVTLSEHQASLVNAEQEKITSSVENLDFSKSKFNIEFLPKPRDFYPKECLLNNQPFCRSTFEQNQLSSDNIIKYDESSIKNNKKTVHQRRHNRAASSESLQITSSTKKPCQLIGQDLLYNRTQSEENISLNLNSHLKRSSSQDSQTFQKPCYVYTKKYIQNFFDESINQSMINGEIDYINLNGLNDNRNDSVIIKRGYNNDYIVPVTNGVPITCSIYNTRLNSQPPRRSSGFSYSIQNDESNFLFNSLLSVQKNLSNQLLLKKEIESGFRIPYTNKDPPGYESSQQNVIKRDQVNVDYKKYNEARFSNVTLKEPPSYSNCVLNMPSNDNKKKSHFIFKNQSRPHSYDGNIETKCNKEVVDLVSTDVKNDPEKRNQPKRTHSMPAVKHIDERSRIAKTFLIDEEAKTPKRLQNKHHQGNCRRKSIDSGTLKKLALELQNNPELGCEYPMISQLLGESQFSAIERRGKNLYRHKSTEAISSQIEDKNVEFL